MTEIRYLSHEEAIQREWRDPEYRRAYRLSKPRYDILRDIIRLRKRLGITQNDLAKKANTHQSRISKIESAELDVRLSTLSKIADALDSDLRIELVPRLSEEMYAQILELSVEPSEANWIPRTKIEGNPITVQFQLEEEVVA